MSGVASGDLRHKVQLQKNLVSQDPDTGEIVSNWTTVAEVLAQIVPMSSREFLAAGAEQSELRGRIVIRWRDGVDASMRVLHRGLYYAIHGVMNDAVSGREHITLQVGEGVRLDQ